MRTMADFKVSYAMKSTIEEDLDSLVSQNEGDLMQDLKADSTILDFERKLINLV